MNLLSVTLYYFACHNFLLPALGAMSSAHTVYTARRRNELLCDESSLKSSCKNNNSKWKNTSRSPSGISAVNYDAFLALIIAIQRKLNFVVNSVIKCMYENWAPTLHTFLSPLSLNIKGECYWHVTDWMYTSTIFFQVEFCHVRSLGGSFPYKCGIYFCLCETDSAQAVPLIHGRQRLIV